MLLGWAAEISQKGQLQEEVITSGVFYWLFLWVLDA